jgi:hypothetical protein
MLRLWAVGVVSDVSRQNSDFYLQELNFQSRSVIIATSDTTPVTQRRGGLTIQDNEDLNHTTAKVKSNVTCKRVRTVFKKKFFFF